jgi:hypothetical protein
VKVRASYLFLRRAQLVAGPAARSGHMKGPFMPSGRWTYGLVSRTVILAFAIVLCLAPAAVARDDPDHGNPTAFHHVGTVTEPAISAIKAGVTATNPTGKFASFDISWVDNQRDVFYLADRSNNAIDVVDAVEGSFIKFLGQGEFAGVITGPPTRSGPDGVVTDKTGIVWAGDGLIGGVGHSSLKGFDPDSGAMIANIDTGGVARSDELAFGNVGGGRILIANPNEPTNAFVTLVNTSLKTIVGKVVYDEPAHAGVPAVGHGFSTNFGGTQHGLEQPAFLRGQFYLNVPATIQNPGGEIDVFDANMAKITAILPLATCGGTGLDIGPRDDLLVECADSFRVIDRNGHEEARVAEFGASDEIWFNPGDGNVYFALAANATLRPGFGGGLGVYDAVHNASLGLTALAGSQGEHSIAVAAKGGKIFIPISDNPDNGAGGIAMMHAARVPHPGND